ncbi:hypothetical protein BAE46_00585 [Glaciecola punicea]|nr:hypothetical protein BAE46_00585 [Glaciecola punicea]
MNKKPTALKMIVFASLVIIVFFGIYMANVNKPLTKTTQCQLQNNACFFSNETLELSVEFTNTPVIEEELTIDFTYSSGFIIKSAWIQGNNMYMGKTPVIMQSSTHLDNTSGITFLGSCSEPKMQWQLFVELQNENTEQTIVYSVLFITEPE